MKIETMSDMRGITDITTMTIPIGTVTVGMVVTRPIIIIEKISLKTDKQIIE